MRQYFICAILVIACMSPARGQDEEARQWYRCGECFVVVLEASAPCPVCRTSREPLLFVPVRFEPCPVCRTQNPVFALACQHTECGIQFRHPLPKTSHERLFEAWEKKGLRGTLFTKTFVPTTGSAELHEPQLRGESRLTLDWQHDWSERIRLSAVLDLRLDTAGLSHGAFELFGASHRRIADVPKYTAQWSGEHLDITLGKFTIPWGRANRINPTNPMPYDYTDLLDEEHIGMVGALAKYSWGVASSVEAVCFPWFTPSLLPVQETTGFLPTLSRYVHDESVEEFRNERGVSFGGRFSTTVRSVDASFSAWQGVETLPAIRIGLLRTQGSPFVYLPYQQVGTDFETVFGQLAVRGETAWRTHDSGDGDDTLHSIVGIDYRRSDVIVDRDALHVFLSYTRYEVLFEGADFEYPYALTNTLIGKLAYTYDEYTEASCSVVTTIEDRIGSSFLNGGDWYVQPKIAKKINGWEVSVGADILGGPNDSFFGSFDGDDRLVIGFKKEF